MKNRTLMYLKPELSVAILNRFVRKLDCSLARYLSYARPWARRPYILLDALARRLSREHEPFAARTCIDLSREVRGPMIALLNQQLANTFDLYSQTKHAHWNVKGAQFFPLHELFDKLAAELADHADVIAERATALGGLAQGTVRMSAANSQLTECDLDVTDSLPIVESLADRYAALAASMRQAIESADGQGDADTADLFTEVSRGLDKSLWFLEAHLQSQD
jgi:starvation-inducible DNA-binding protein